MNRVVEVKTVYTHSWSSEGAKNDQMIQIRSGWSLWDRRRDSGTCWRLSIYHARRKSSPSQKEGSHRELNQPTPCYWTSSLRIQHQDYIDFLLLFRTIFRFVSKTSPFLGYTRLPVISQSHKENSPLLDPHIKPHGIESDFPGQPLRDWSLPWEQKTCSCAAIAWWAQVPISSPSQAKRKLRKWSPQSIWTK